MQVVGRRGAAYVVAHAGAADDVGVVGRHHRLALGVAAVGDDQGDVPVLEGGEVGDERVEVVRGLDQHEPARRTPGPGPVRDPLGEAGVAQHRAVGHHRGRLAEVRVVEDRRRAAEEVGLRGREGHDGPAGR